MKKFLSLLLSAVLVVSMTACGGSTDKPAEENEKEVVEVTDPAFDVKITDEMKEAAKDFYVGMVTDTGGIDDRSFNQGTWEGIQMFSALTGAQPEYAQSNSDADYIPNLSTFAEDGANIIVAAGFLFADAMNQVAANFPDTNFLIVDEALVEVPNVVSAVFAAEQGSYLVGVAAAEMAKANSMNKVGFIGGGDFPLIQDFEVGFEDGVASVDPNIEVLVDYVGDFSDTGKSQSIASKMYDEGAYAIFHAAGGAGNGLIKEAKDRRLNGQDVWAIGVDRDQYEEGIYDEEGHSAMLTSMIKRVDVASFDISLKALKGEFPGGESIVYDINNGGVDIPKENPNLTPQVQAKVEEAKEKMKKGEITINEVPKRLAGK